MAASLRRERDEIVERHREEIQMARMQLEEAESESRKMREEMQKLRSSSQWAMTQREIATSEVMQVNLTENLVPSPELIFNPDKRQSRK